jgi:hypothetical protein
LWCLQVCVRIQTHSEGWNWRVPYAQRTKYQQTTESNFSFF